MIWFWIAITAFVALLVAAFAFRRPPADSTAAWEAIVAGLYLPPFPAGAPREFQESVAKEPGEFDETAAAYPDHHVSITLDGTRTLIETLERGALENWLRSQPAPPSDSVTGYLDAVDKSLVGAKVKERMSAAKAASLIGHAGSVLGRRLVESKNGRWLYRWGGGSSDVGFWASSVEIDGRDGKVEVNPFLEARRRLIGERSAPLADPAGHRDAPSSGNA